MSIQEYPHEVDELLPVDVVPAQANVKILLVVRAVRPQDVQSLASRPNASQETLPDQQPAAVHQIHPPNGMTSIHIIAAGARRVFAVRLALVTPYFLDEGPLFVGIAFPEKGGHLVISGTNAAEQILDARGGIRRCEGVLEPLPDLLRTVELPRGNLLLELLDLTRRQFAWIAFVAEKAEG